MKEDDIIITESNYSDNMFSYRFKLTNLPEINWSVRINDWYGEDEPDENKEKYNKLEILTYFSTSSDKCCTDAFPLDSNGSMLDLHHCFFERIGNDEFYLLSYTFAKESSDGFIGILFNSSDDLNKYSSTPVKSFRTLDNKIFACYRIDDSNVKSPGIKFDSKLLAKLEHDDDEVEFSDSIVEECYED